MTDATASRIMMSWTIIEAQLIYLEDLISDERDTIRRLLDAEREQAKPRKPCAPTDSQGGR